MYRITSDNDNARFQDMLRSVEQEREHLLYLDDETILQERNRPSLRRPLQLIKLVLAAMIRQAAG